MSNPSAPPSLASPPPPTSRTTPTRAPLLSGALAGLTVDLSLYPLDTLKTRLQSSRGFLASGGFTGVYRGLGSVVLGSAPGGALFFSVYEASKARLGDSASAHVVAASLGEVAACAVRVPTEVVKQRAQARQAASSRAALAEILARRGAVGVVGVWMELYRGWSVTVLREVPFTAIQFPLWEGLKAWGVRRRRGEGGGGSATTAESAAFGCVSGGVAAAATTPLDVLKTRLMLAREKRGMLEMTGEIWREEGGGAFLRGMGPRIAWISIGGAVFLGSYQWAFNLLSDGGSP